MRKIQLVLVTVILLTATVAALVAGVRGERLSETGAPARGDGPPAMEAQRTYTVGHAQAQPEIIQELGVQAAAGLEAPDPYTLVAPRSYLHGHPATGPDSTVFAVIEIPAGSVDKWEVDKKDGSLRWEFRDGKPRKVRYLGYPVNYGMVPRTVLAKELDGGDGDPLDVLVLGASLPRGSIVPVRIVAVLRMRDRGERDDKLVAVRAGTPFEEIHNLPELELSFPGITTILSTWFDHYKGPGVTETRGFGDVQEAWTTLEATSKAFEAKQDGS